MHSSLKTKHIMNATSLVRLSAIALVLVTAAVGCKKKPERITKIPGLGQPAVIGDAKSAPLDGGNALAESTVPKPGDLEGKLPLDGGLAGWVRAAEQPFAADTVYFDFDKAVVKPSEITKVERVATAMKSYPGKALRIEGHCDERGTEEYNRALGEKRALAVREQLVTASMESRLVDTISFGEDRPAQPGHDQGAWSKNRRAEFILLEPPASASLR
jgi:peptidoglycan-associated lipoprotein